MFDNPSSSHLTSEA